MTIDKGLIVQTYSIHGYTILQWLDRFGNDQTDNKGQMFEYLTLFNVQTFIQYYVHVDRHQ